MILNLTRPLDLATRKYRGWRNVLNTAPGIQSAKSIKWEILQNEVSSFSINKQVGEKEKEQYIRDFFFNKETYLPNAKCGLYLDSD